MALLPMAPVAELRSRSILGAVLLWQPVGLCLLAMHVLLVRESIWLLPLVPCITGWLYFKSPLGGLSVFFQILIYQNVMISLFSPGMDYMPSFVVLSGTNFLVLCILAVIALARLITPQWWRQFRGVILFVLAALAMMVGYSVIGAAKEGPTSALIYFREFSAPMFAALVGLDVGRVWGFKTIGNVFIFSVILSIALGVVEYCIPLDYYRWTNQVTFYQLKYLMQPENNVFYSPADIVSHFTNAFLNISGSTTQAGTTFRFGGSIITPTSFAYVLSVVGMVAISVRRSAWLIVILPLMFLVGAKGASLLLIFSVVLFGVWKLSRNRTVVFTIAVLLSVGYIGAGLIIGLQNNDYHVIGFMGGVHSLVSTPLGHGVGVGGNMSANANAGFKMDGPGGFTQAGADFALESAIGVLFYQTGIASILVFAVFAALLRATPLGEAQGERVIPVRRDVIYFAVAMILVNGVFQEEAYSPYAAGMIMLLCSCIVGNGRRRHVIAPAGPSPQRALRPAFAR